MKGFLRFMVRLITIRLYAKVFAVSSLVIRRLRFLKMRRIVEAGRRKGVYIQIGAGAGDLDLRAGCKDGFSQLVKSIDPKLIANIVLVEPNKLNIPLLIESWSNFENVNISNLAITPARFGYESCKIFWSPLDGPNFQTASIDPYHVLNHFPTQRLEDLQVVECDCVSLDNFLAQFELQHIKLLGLDIEGIDDEVILETDFRRHDIDLISFEFIHMEEKLEEVKNHLEDCGYRFVGYGLDVNQFDYLYRNSKYA